MMVNNMLLIMVLFVILPAPLVYLLGKRIGKKISWLVFALLLGFTLFLAGLFPYVENEPIIEALALLLTGAGLSLPNWLAIGRVFGVRKAVVYVLTIVVLGTLVGWMAGFLLA